MIRFGIIGSNFITDRFIEASKQVDDVQITALYSRTMERANEYGDQHHIVYRFDQLDTMFQSDVIDAVYVASPTSFHAQHAIAAMEAGKHVLCEKPFASNEREVKQMIATAKRNGVVLMEAMKSTVTPAFAAIRAKLPDIGPVRRYFASYCQYSSRYDAYKEGTILNAFRPEFSNGALMDIGIYCIYPAIALFGKPDAIQAQGFMLSSGVDGQGSLLLQYKDGIDAIISYSKITNSYVPSEILGEQGNIIIDSISEPKQITIRYRDGRVEELDFSAQSESIMKYEIAEFVQVIRAGLAQSTLNSHQNAEIVMATIDEARKQMGVVYPADC